MVRLYSNKNVAIYTKIEASWIDLRSLLKYIYLRWI